MKRLEDSNLSFILLTLETDQDYIESKKIYERAISIFYSKDYSVFPISNFKNETFHRTILAVSESHTNDDLRKDSIFLIDSFHKENIIVKYKNESNAVRINKNGSETLLRIIENNRELDTDEFFLDEGFSFSFESLKRYYYPKKKEDLKKGMIVEFFNNQKWVRKPIDDLDIEFDKLYKLLIKYNKLRVEVNQN